MFLKTAALIIFIFSMTVQARTKRKTEPLTPFQKNIQTCLNDDGVDVNKLTSLQKIYDAVSERYPLFSSEVLGREVLYKVKDESRKLQYQDGKLKISKILEDEDERVVPLDNEVRQRSLTTEAYLTQLLIHADIRSDWMKVSEKRSGSTVVVLTTQDGDIKNLQIQKTALKKKLECSHTETSESCSCTDLN